ncbi:hypothetical protein [Ornithinibacillus californiensis]|uniref:hypothetical protein n=1 Tax=Ornithinibacillus californiensis TaxID=161536 RepID=UPI00069D5F83|nr:hypothetical protein [Ornithinibacillus californiensis]
MRLSIILIVISLCIAIVLPSSAKPGNGEEQNDTQYAITHDQIVQLTDNFMDILVQKTDENYQVKDHHNKASLIEVFKSVISEEVVKPYVDYYFHEKNGALYIIPTETPPWFDKQNEYDVIQLENNKVLVQQKNQSELYGDYSLEIEFTFADQEWKITNITHQ